MTKQLLVFFVCLFGGICSIGISAQNIEVKGTDDLGSGQHPGNDENSTGSQCDIGAVLTESQHQHISRRKEENGR